jgi:hypothetical protein
LLNCMITERRHFSYVSKFSLLNLVLFLWLIHSFPDYCPYEFIHSCLTILLAKIYSLVSLSQCWDWKTTGVRGNMDWWVTGSSG